MIFFRNRPSFFFCLVVATLGGALFAYSAPDPAVHLDTDIRLVATGGFWEHEGRYGTCRVVVRGAGWEHARSLVYVKWLMTDDSAKTVKIFRSQPVRELSKEAWTHVRSVRLKPGGKQNFFEIRFSKREDAKRIRTVSLVLLEPGRYDLVEQ